MSNEITLARPYAKAIFEHALMGKTLGYWKNTLMHLSGFIQNTDVCAFFENPAVSNEQKLDVLLSYCQRLSKDKVTQSLENLFKLLIANKRVMLLPEIHCLFETLLAQHEKTIVVNVTSFTKLSQDQQDKLTTSLVRRLNRQVSLQITIDKSLLGGAIIQAGDLVIDGSVRGQLEKLSASLVA